MIQERDDKKEAIDEVDNVSNDDDGEEIILGSRKELWSSKRQFLEQSKEGMGGMLRDMMQENEDKNRTEFKDREGKYLEKGREHSFVEEPARHGRMLRDMI